MKNFEKLGRSFGRARVYGRIVCEIKLGPDDWKLLA